MEIVDPLVGDADHLLDRLELLERTDMRRQCGALCLQYEKRAGGAMKAPPARRSPCHILSLSNRNHYPHRQGRSNRSIHFVNVTHLVPAVLAHLSRKRRIARLNPDALMER